MKPPHSAHLSLNSDDAAAGCLLGILGRILCGSMRNGAAGNDANDEGERVQVMRRIDQKTVGSPSVVARLMGLDSMPVFPCSSSPDSLHKSRSANSVESWSEFGCSERRRRVHGNTSVSFREAPTYLSQENEDFLLLSFSPEDGLPSAARRKSKVTVEDTISSRNNAAEKESRRENITGSRKKKKKKIDKNSSEKENLPKKNHAGTKEHTAPSGKNNAQSRACSGAKSENCGVRTPLKNSKVATRKKLAFATVMRLEDVECTSQDSSPVSVLNHHPYVCGESSSSSCSSPTSGEEEQWKQHCSRRLSAKFEVSPLTSPNQNFDAIGKGQVRNQINSHEAAPDHNKIWGMICMLTVGDVTNMSWISKEVWRLEEVSEITAVVALDVLDLLLQDAVSEMCSHITL